MSTKPPSDLPNPIGRPHVFYYYEEKVGIAACVGSVLSVPATT
jgi:hypothetical protein